MRVCLAAAVVLAFLFHLLIWPSWREARILQCSLKDTIVFNLTAWCAAKQWNRAARWLLTRLPPTCKRCRAEATAASARRSPG